VAGARRLLLYDCAIGRQISKCFAASPTALLLSSVGVITTRRQLPRCTVHLCDTRWRLRSLTMWSDPIGCDRVCISILLHQPGLWCTAVQLVKVKTGLVCAHVTRPASLFT
jgi:hypothetical protein